MSDLPDEVDCVILGTGLANSIIAASCARVGKSVLHLDDKGYYGDDWASFSFDQLLEWTKIQQQREEQQEKSSIEISTTDQLTFKMRKTTQKDPIFSNTNVIINEKFNAIVSSSNAAGSLQQDSKGAKRIRKDDNPNEGCFGDTTPQNTQMASRCHGWTIDELREKSKLFCIDLNPRLIYSNGVMVDLLVNSNVSRYHEFKNTVRLISLIDGKLQILPCKRNEVFSSQILPNLIDKRRLMKFLELCVEFNEDKLEESQLKDCLGMGIENCLIERDLGPNLRHLIINSIAMVDPSTPTLVACKKIKKFLHSVERFGKSPFLFPIYGCGEFPQSFCRMSAVFGGVYCLNKKVESLKIIQNDGDSQAQMTLNLDDGKLVKCKKLVLNYSQAITAKIIQGKTAVRQSRGILVATTSFCKNTNDHISFSRLPAGIMSNKYPIFVLEVNSSVMVCPTGLSLVYIWTKSNKDNATNDLLPIVKELYEKNHEDNDTKTEGDILWSCYYNKLVQLHDDDNSCSSDLERYGIVVTSLESSDDPIDYEKTVNEATNTFQKLFPGEEFLPRAPDPDEIVFDGQDVAI